MKIPVFIFLIALFISCDQDEIEHFRNSNSNINIYIVKEGQLEFQESEINLNALELENTPWIKNSDIEFYDWSAQSFYLNKEAEKGKYSGRHFVVTSGEKRLFAGVFFPMFMSSFPSLPSISPEDGFFSPKDVIRFGHFGTIRPGQLDENQEFKSELISAGKLREGIKVELTNLKRQSSATLIYTFKVTNLEADVIYILDPQKMGSPRFHYYTNGVSLIKDDSYYWPQDFETIPSDNIKQNWYYRLTPGKSITRTVEITGYSALPSGKVKATFHFPGANLKNSGEWKKPDGRIWLGDFICEQELTLR